MSSFKKLAWSATLALGLSVATSGAQATALTLTLPTTNLDADAVFSFNADVYDVMNGMGLYALGLGNSKQTTTAAGAGISFNMPVTQVSLATSLLPFYISPVSGKASGSALGIYGDEGGLVLANFSLDFKRNVLSADLTTSKGTVKGFDVYNFHVADNLHVSTSGGLSMKMSLDHMMLTDAAQASFASALALPDFAVAILGNLDFGTLAINIAPGLRFDVSDKAFTTSMVPEVPPMVMLSLGFLGIAAISRRKQAV